MYYDRFTLASWWRDILSVQATIESTGRLPLNLQNDEYESYYCAWIGLAAILSNWKTQVKSEHQKDGDQSKMYAYGMNANIRCSHPSVTRPNVRSKMMCLSVVTALQCDIQLPEATA